VLLPAPPRSWTLHCQPSIRDRRQRDYESRVAYRAKRAAEAKGEVYVAPSTPEPITSRAPPPPPSPSSITSFPQFGRTTDAPIVKWKPSKTVLQPPLSPQPKRIVLKPATDTESSNWHPYEQFRDDDSDWDEELEEDFVRFENEQDLVIFER